MSESDRVHEAIFYTFMSLEVEGWQYRGYRPKVRNRDRLYLVRFEKYIIDRMAFCEVELTDPILHPPYFGLADHLRTKLREVETALAVRRSEQKNRAA